MEVISCEAGPSSCEAIPGADSDNAGKRKRTRRLPREIHRNAGRIWKEWPIMTNSSWINLLRDGNGTKTRTWQELLPLSQSSSTKHCCGTCPPVSPKMPKSESSLWSWWNLFNLFKSLQILFELCFFCFFYFLLILHMNIWIPSESQATGHKNSFPAIRRHQQILGHHRGKLPRFGRQRSRSWRLHGGAMQNAQALFRLIQMGFRGSSMGNGPVVNEDTITLFIGIAHTIASTIFH